MSTWLNIFLMLAEDEPGDTESALKKIVPLLIIMILYGLSSIFKGRQQKKPPPSTKPPPQYKPIEKGESSQQQRLPSYARQATTRPGPAQPQPSPRPVATSPTRQPGAQGLPQRPPVRQQPTPTRPVPAQPRHPAPVARQPMERIPRPAQPSTAAGQSAGAAAMAVIRAKKEKHQAQLAYEQQKKRDAAQAAQQLHRDVTPPLETPVPTVSTQEKLLLALQQSDEAARAIVYAEIIGKPLALRKSGLYEF
jgi:hypothetical protein